MNDDHYQEQDGEDGETEGSFEESVTGWIQSQTELSREIIKNNEHVHEILKELTARIERLEQNM